MQGMRAQVRVTPERRKEIAEQINREMAIACGWQPVAAQWHDGWFKYTLVAPGNQIDLRQVRPATNEPERWQAMRYWPDYLNDRCVLPRIWDAIETAGVSHLFMRVLLQHRRNTYLGAFRAMRKEPEEQVKAALMALNRWQSAWDELYAGEG